MTTQNDNIYYYKGDYYFEHYVFNFQNIYYTVLKDCFEKWVITNGIMDTSLILERVEPISLITHPVDLLRNKAKELLK